MNAKTYAEVRAALIERREIALLDVREEDPHAQAHPLFAANLSLSRLELEAYARLPRRDVPIVTLDDGEGLAERAAKRLTELGYTDVSVLAGGVKGWQAAGGELFRDVNVPSKAFGELVDATRHTPSLPAEEVRALLDAKADVVVVDVRRFDEYQTMNIPGSTSVPGAELLLRVPELAPNPKTSIIVNCAGRTRSIIGTQSLVNAGIPNPVAALCNGTIGWTLAGQTLEHGADRRCEATSESTRQQAAARAHQVAKKAGVRWLDSGIGLDTINEWKKQQGRTTYFIDVRDAEEYAAGHLQGFRSVPGGQLVQETEMSVTVRGARIVLVDNDGVRANMTASWLAQMAWEVYVLAASTPNSPLAWTETGAWQAPLPPIPNSPDVAKVAPATLNEWLQSEEPPVVIDLTAHANYCRAHIPGAWYALRAQLKEALPKLPKASRYVLTCLSGLLGYYAQAEFAALVEGKVFALEGGTNAWKAAGLPLEQTGRLASEPLDRYRRPYEGTDNSADAMQAYLDWEFGLVKQLERDGTHHFKVI